MSAATVSTKQNVLEYIITLVVEDQSFKACSRLNIIATNIPVSKQPKAWSCICVLGIFLLTL